MLKLNMYGQYLGVILIFTAVNLPFAVLTFSSFVTGIPREIDEAAIIDGCGTFSLIFKVLLPIIILYLVLQKYIIEGMTAGAGNFSDYAGNYRFFYQYLFITLSEQSAKDFDTIIAKSAGQYEKLLYDMDRTALQIAANPSIVKAFQ